MKLALFALALLVAGIPARRQSNWINTSPQSDERQSGHVKIIPITYDHTTTFGVIVDNPQDGDQVAIDVYYWVNFPGMSKRIVRCSTSVIPAISEAPSAGDMVPVDLADVMKVRVRVLHVVNEEIFGYKTAEEEWSN